MRHSQYPLYQFFKLAVSLFCVISASLGASNPNDDPEEVSQNIEVAGQDLVHLDQFWPYQVSLTDVCRVGDDQVLDVGLTGVFLGVNRSGERLRVDFGRDGVHLPLIEQTDFCERVDAIRQGKRVKLVPNLVRRFSSRLACYNEGLKPYAYDRDASYEVWIILFADPLSDQFESFRPALDGLLQNQKVFTFLFPQGGKEDFEIGEILSDANLELPFMYNYLRASYLHTIGDYAKNQQLALVYTPNGRLLLESGLEDVAVDDILSALPSLSSE